MIFDRLIYLTKWILYTIPEFLFAVFFFVFASKRDEKALANPIFWLSAYPFSYF